MNRRLLVLAAISAGLTSLAHQPPGAEAAPPKLYLFLHDGGSPNQIHRYQVSPLGTLIATAGSPIDPGNTNTSCGGDCQTMAYSARRKLLFSTGGSGVSVIDISKEPPVPVPGTPFGAFRALGVVAVEKGRNTFVYAADVDNNQIRGFRVTSGKTLEPLASSPYPAGIEPVGMSAVRDLVFAANEDGAPSTISAYKVAVDGALVPAPGNPLALPAGTFAYNVDVDPQGRFVYSADCNNPRISAFKINPRTAALTPVAGSPFATNTGAVCSGVAFPAPNLLYAVNIGVTATNIQALRKNGRGVLTPFGAAQSSVTGSPGTVATDPSGRYLAIPDQTADTVRLFSINKRNGVVTPGTPVSVILDRANAVLFLRR